MPDRSVVYCYDKQELRFTIVVYYSKFQTKGWWSGVEVFDSKTPRGRVDVIPATFERSGRDFAPPGA